MKRRSGAAIILILFACGLLAATKIPRGTTAAKPFQNDPSIERNTIRWYAQEARNQGKTEINVPPPIAEIVDEIKNMDDILDHETVVIARAIEAKTYVQNKRTIITWYRLKIIENLSQKDIHSCVSCPFPAGVPEDMLTVEPDEILIAHYGGTLNVDGVKVTTNLGAFSTFSPNKPYLFFLGIESPGQFALVPTGDVGVSAIDGDSLEPLGGVHHPLRKHMLNEYGSEDGKISLTKLREHLRKRNAKGQKPGLIP